MPFSIFFANLGKNLRFSCWQGKKNAIQAAIASIRGVLCIILAHNVPLPRRSRSSISFGIRVQKLIKNAERVCRNADLSDFVGTHGSCVRRVISCILY